MAENGLLKIWDSIKPMAEKLIGERTRDCARMKKMTVTTAYNAETGLIGVKSAFSKEVFLPTYGGVDASALAVGTGVWVLVPYSNFSNAMVFMRGDGKGISGGGGGSTVTVTQKQAKGVEIASVSVDGTSTPLYAPNDLSSQILPIYIGDFLSGEAETNFPGTYPGCCVKIGDYIYAFCGGGSDTNTGIIRRFDLVNNVEDRAWAKTALVGHANSCAYDSNTGTVYVVPLRDYSVTPSVVAQYVYAYDATDFSYIGTVSTPTSIQAISFDPVAKKLYYYGYHGRIYVRDTDAADGWTVICWVKTDNLSLAPRPNTHSFDQDFAVYDGRFYLSSAHGNVCTGRVYSTNPAIPETGWTIAKLDSTARFYLGEPEGLEFTDDGHLIGLNFVEILGNLWDTFVVEYPVGEVPSYAPMIGEADSYHDGTITLSEATQLKFGLWTYEIRSLAQMEIRFLKTNSSVIMIPSENVVADLYKIRMNDAIKLLINGEYQCEQLAIQHGYVNIQTGMSGAQLTLTTADEDPILLRHASRLAFTGDNRLLVSTPNKPSSWNGTNFISIGYDFPILASRVHPNSVQGKTLRVAGTPILWDIFYMGSYPLYAPKLVYCSKSNYSNNYVTGTDFTGNSNCIITGWHAAQARLNIPVSAPLPSDGTEVFVGRFTCLTSGNSFDTTQTTIAPSQSGTNPPVLITFYNSGYISLKCYGAMTCSSTNKEWYRTVLPALPASGWWTNTNIFN